MAEGLLFGAPIGDMAFDANRRGNLNTQIQLMKVLDEMSQTPGQINLRDAQAGHHRAQTADLNQKVQQTELLGRLAQQAAAQGGAMVEQFDRMAITAAGAGLTHQASELAKTASTIRTQTQTAANAAAGADLHRLQTVEKRAEVIGQFFGGAQSQGDLDSASALYEMQTGQPSPMKGMMWSPALTQSIRDMALSAKEKAAIEQRDITEQRTEEHQRERRKQHDANIRIAQERLRLEQERERRLAQNGGPNRGNLNVSKEDQARAESLIKQQFKDVDFDVNERTVASFNIAAEAKAKMRANPALSLSQAMNQAFSEALSAGDLQVDKGRIYGQKFRYAGGGRSKETALPMPKKAEEAKDGRYYLNPNGVLVRFKDGKWEAAQ